MTLSFIPSIKLFNQF